MRMVGLLEQATGKAAVLDFQPMQPGDVDTPTSAPSSATMASSPVRASTKAFPASSNGSKTITASTEELDARSRHFRPSAHPVIGAPLFIVSNPDLVIAQCKAGIVGSFPALNARPQSQLDEWIHQITEELAAHDDDIRTRPSAPFAVNQIVHRSNDRFEEDMMTCAKWKVPIVITSWARAPSSTTRFMAGAGSRFTTSSTTATPARRSKRRRRADRGRGRRRRPCRPLVAVRAGPGNPQMVRRAALAWARSPPAAQCWRPRRWAPTSPISARRSSPRPKRATDEYKQAIIEGGAADIVTSALFTGVSGNYLRASIVAAGLDPDDLPQPGPTR